MEHRVTIRDVANAAGVSIATVSRAINEADLVSSETKNLVQQAIRATGYRARRHTQSLANMQHRTITMLHESFSTGDDPQSPAETSRSWSQHSALVSAGIQDILIGTDHHLRMVSMPSYLHSTTNDVIQDWLDRVGKLEETDGLILTNPRINDYLAEYIVNSGLNCVVIGKCSAPLAQIDVDNVEGFRELTCRILALGHREVAYLGPDADITVHRDRFQGFLEAFEQMGVPLPQNHWLKTTSEHSPYSFKDARNRVLKAIEANELPTAIMAFNDEVAYGAIQALTSRGLRVPEDVSVTGFDDLPSTEMYSPPLTTVRSDPRLIGHHVTRSLMRQLQGGTVPPLTILPVEVIFRESVRRLE